MTQDSEEKNEISNLSLDQGDACSDTTYSLVSQPPVVLEPGEVILEKFRIIELLGRGGMGSVYRVEHLLVNRIYALKCLSKSQTNDAGWRRFQNEAKAAHMLDHANLIRVYEFGLLPGGQPFFLMELVEGSTLADEIKKSGRLELERALKIFIKVAFAIQYAHEHKVIHRDLKPSNIMLSKSSLAHEPEIVKVVDFGIAKLTGQDEFNQQTLTKTGEVFGSPLFMSPEQCIGIAVDHRSDLYSLGCVFYETLTGAPPFIGDSALSTMLKHQSDRQLSLREASMGGQFPAEMEHIIEKLLQKDPDHRYQTANALAEDLIELEKVVKGEKLPEGRAGLGSATQKLEQKRTAPREKISIEANVFVVLGVSTFTFVLGMILSYVILTMQSGDPKFTIPRCLLFDQEKKPAQAIQSSPLPQKTASWSSKKEKYLEFHFPENESLGFLEFKDGTQMRARGLVKVPLGQPLGLSASNYLLQNPQLLDGFQPEELQVLDLGGSKNLKPEIFSHLKRLTGLRILNLSGTDFGDGDLEFLSGLGKLRDLNLATTHVTGKSLLKCPILKNLNCLDITCLDDGELIARQVSNLPNLKQLVIAGTDIKDVDLADLAKSKSIKILCIAQNFISNQGIANLVPLQTLEWIDVTATNIKPESCKYFAQMPSLKLLEVGKMFEDHSRQTFALYMQKHRPKVKILWENVHTGDLASSMPTFPWAGNGALTHLDLDLGKIIDLPQH